MKYQVKKSPQRKIPIVTAVLACVFFAILIFGATSVILANLRREIDGDVGFHLDGAWETDNYTVNDEIIIFIFSSDSFTSVTTRKIFDVTQEALIDFIDFYEIYHGARVYTELIEYSNYQVRIYESGDFTLEGSSIMLDFDGGSTVWLPFYWDGDAIIINGDRYLRQ